ncbi:MAG: hypothetical protein HY985_09630 [Magnetospirillum sp.]|nr:hypothetical protein [Magnetospirillum sp.]
MPRFPLVLVFVLAACRLGETSEAIVALADLPTVMPRHIVIRPGETVEWRNAARTPYTLSGEDFPTPTLPPGALWRHTFDTPGITVYRVEHGRESLAEGIVEVR